MEVNPMNYIRDSQLNVIGRIDENQSCQYIYDQHGRLLATNHKKTDLTINASGSESLKGNQLVRFLGR
jgi:YD repeat-containing protein